MRELDDAKKIVTQSISIHLYVKYDGTNSKLYHKNSLMIRKIIQGKKTYDSSKSIKNTLY